MAAPVPTVTDSTQKLIHTICILDVLSILSSRSLYCQRNSGGNIERSDRFILTKKFIGNLPILSFFIDRKMAQKLINKILKRSI